MPPRTLSSGHHPHSPRRRRRRRRGRSVRQNRLAHRCHRRGWRLSLKTVLPRHGVLAKKLLRRHRRRHRRRHPRRRSLCACLRNPRSTRSGLRRLHLVYQQQVPVTPGALSSVILDRQPQKGAHVSQHLHDVVQGLVAETRHRGRRARVWRVQHDLHGLLSKVHTRHQLGRRLPGVQPVPKKVSTAAVAADATRAKRAAGLQPRHDLQARSPHGGTQRPQTLSQRARLPTLKHLLLGVKHAVGQQRVGLNHPAVTCRPRGTHAGPRTVHNPRTRRPLLGLPIRLRAGVTPTRSCACSCSCSPAQGGRTARL